MIVRLNVITTLPSWLYPVVFTLTIPAFGRDFDSRFSKTSVFSFASAGCLPQSLFVRIGQMVPKTLEHAPAMPHPSSTRITMYVHITRKRWALSTEAHVLGVGKPPLRGVGRVVPEARWWPPRGWYSSGGHDELTDYRW